MYEAIVEKPFQDASLKGAAYISYDLLEELVIEKLIDLGLLVRISSAQMQLTVPVDSADVRLKEAEDSRAKILTFEEFVGAEYTKINKAAPRSLQRSSYTIFLLYS